MLLYSIVSLIEKGQFCLHALYEELYNSGFCRFVSLCICSNL